MDTLSNIFNGKIPALDKQEDSPDVRGESTMEESSNAYGAKQMLGLDDNTQQGAGAKQMLGLDMPTQQGYGAKQMLGLDMPSAKGGGFMQMMGTVKSKKKSVDPMSMLGMGHKGSKDIVGDILGGSKKTSGKNNPLDMLGMGKGKKQKNPLDMLGMGKQKKNNFFNTSTSVPKSVVQPMKPLNVFGMGSKGVNFNTENIGWNRMKAQKNLTPFGDADGDKVANILDCQPRNPLEQGFMDDIKSGAGRWVGERFKKKEEEPVETVAPTYQDTTTVDAGYADPSMTVDPKEKTYVEQLSPAKRRDYELSQQQKRETQAEILRLEEVAKQKRIDDFREKMSIKKREQDVELSKAEFAGQTTLRKAEIEAKSEMAKAKLKEAKQAELREFGGYPWDVGAPLRKTKRTLSKATYGMPVGSAVQQQMSYGQGLASDAQKVSSLMGLGGQHRPSTLGFEQEPQVQEQQQESGIRTVQYDPEVSTISPYSKRAVTYVRGPYRKSQR